MEEQRITYYEFYFNWETIILINKTSNIREGQSLMNYLSEVWNEEYINISSVHYYDRTDIDCFYNDDLIPNTLKHLKEVWNKNN